MPDLFVHFTLTGFPYTRAKEAPAAFLFEIDRGTELNPYTIQDKIEKYLTLTEGLHEEIFNASAISIVFVFTLGGENRLKQLLAWAKHYFKQHGSDGADLFLFTCCDPEESDPVTFFTKPMFHGLTSAKLQPLIEKRYPVGSTLQFPQRKNG